MVFLRPDHGDELARPGAGGNGYFATRRRRDGGACCDTLPRRRAALTPRERGPGGEHRICRWLVRLSCGSAVQAPRLVEQCQDSSKAGRRAPMCVVGSGILTRRRRGRGARNEGQGSCGCGPDGTADRGWLENEEGKAGPNACPLRRGFGLRSVDGARTAQTDAGPVPTGRTSPEAVRNPLVRTPQARRRRCGSGERPKRQRCAGITVAQCECAATNWPCVSSWRSPKVAVAGAFSVSAAPACWRK